jgi:hypothetical protein
MPGLSLSNHDKSMTDAELLLTLFEGSDAAHGRSEIGAKGPKGKMEAKSWLEKRPVTLQDWESHLEGIKGIGLPPINTRNEVKWGAIDVDVYEGLDLGKLNKSIQDAKLPLVICRSKSGGPHIFLFLKDWVPAKSMIEALDGIAGFLGFGKSEIFPKQSTVAHSEDSSDFGSWINMPYFGGVRNLRYGIDESGTALKTIREFVAYVETKKIDLPDLPDVSTGIAPAEDTDVPLPDGPPCLNRLMSAGVTDMRNIVLSNIAVYCKKRWPEGWAAKLDEYNQRFPEPLGSSEVEAIKKSYGKKDYRFQCSKQPLCSYCNSSACKKAAFGIGGQDLLPANRSLTMVATVPPIWYLDITITEGIDKRISLTTEELQNSRLFQRRCMESLQRMPPAMKAEEWEPIVSALMEHCTVIEIPPEMSPTGQFIDLIKDFLANRATQDSFEDLIRGLPYRDIDGWHLRPKDLWAHVKQQRFEALKQHQMIAVLKDQLQAAKGFKKIAGVGVNYITIPKDALVSDEPEGLTTPDYTEKSPF